MLLVALVVVRLDVVLAAMAHHQLVEAVTLIATTVAAVLEDVEAAEVASGDVAAAMTVMAIMIVALGSAVLWDQEDPIAALVVHAVIVASDLARPIDAGSNSKASL